MHVRCVARHEDAAARFTEAFVTQFRVDCMRRKSGVLLNPTVYTVSARSELSRRNLCIGFAAVVKQQATRSGPMSVNSLGITRDGRKGRGIGLMNALLEVKNAG